MGLQENINSKINPFNNMFFRIKQDGKYSFRFLNNYRNLYSVPFFSEWVHFNFADVKKEKNKIFQCLGSGCPACEFVRGLGSEHQEVKDRLKSQPVNTFYVLNSNNEIKILSASRALFEKLIGGNGIQGALVSSLYHGVDVFDYKNGKIVEITKNTDEEGYVKWVVDIGADSALPNSLIKHVETELKDLSSFYPYLPAYEISKFVEDTKILMGV